ncbi:MAG TPA: hypothetical protein VKA27_10580 [Sunxiuqinia sp.]|nr:hypothetical protein [Sunxiuqinia sp.]
MAPSGYYRQAHSPIIKRLANHFQFIPKITTQISNKTEKLPILIGNQNLVMSIPLTMRQKTYLRLGIFGIAMGFLEAIVVIYLRQLYFPDGFHFPLPPMPARILNIEWLREISTIVMLAVVGIVAGRNFLQRLTWFLYTFAVWDIFFYVALKLLIGWPPSLFTWDLLFLIPLAWDGPVLAPIISSLTMIVMTEIITGLQEKGYLYRIIFREWFLIISGAFVIFCTFIWDYFSLIVRHGYLSKFWSLSSNADFQQIVSNYVPSHYHWFLFSFGELLIILALVLIVRRSKANYEDNLLASE